MTFPADKPMPAADPAVDVTLGSDSLSPPDTSDCTLALPDERAAASPSREQRPVDQTLALPDGPSTCAPAQPPPTQVPAARRDWDTQPLSVAGEPPSQSRLDQTLTEPAEFSSATAHPAGPLTGRPGAPAYETAPLTAGDFSAGPPVPPTRHGHDPHAGGLTGAPLTEPLTAADARARRTVVPGYEILGELGRGGMGVVYKARQLRLNRVVALKMIRAGAQASSEDLRRFKVEAEAVARLSHPNIVQIYEIAEHDGLPYFSLEYIDGGSLHQQLDKDTGMPAGRAAALVETLARAMHYAHEQGIAHRDLKPANILLQIAPGLPGESGRPPASRGLSEVPKITDFGLAKHLEKDTTQTREGSILGTPSYMAPEQAEGRNKDIGPASDIYSLGAILYDLLASRPPFRGETVMDTLHQVINVDPMPPTQLQPCLARDLETICLKCLQKEIKKRYATAAELADDLARFLHNEPIQARATPAWEKAVKWARRRPALASLVMVVFLTVVGLVAGSSWYARHESQRANTEAGLRAEAVTERDRADTNAAEEKRQRKRADDKAAEAERQRAIAVRESDRAKRRFRDAIAAVDRVVIQAAAQRLQHVPQLQTVRCELLQDALHFYRLYLVDKGNDTALREDNGITHRRMGDILEKLGETRKAEDAYKTALVFFSGLLEEAPRDLHYRRNVAETSNNLAIVLQTREQFAEAAKVLDRAVLLLRGMKGDYPDALRKQALVLGAAVLGPVQAGEQRWNAVWDLVAAETTTREANIRLALLGDSLLSRGNLRLALKQPGPAGEDFTAASALYEQLARQDPAEPEYPFHLAAAQNSLGGLLAGRDPNKAGAAFDRAIRLLKPLTEHFARVASYRALLAQVLRNRAVVRLLHPRPGAATEQDQRLVEKDLGDSVDLFARLAAEYTTVPEHRAELVNSRKTLAIFYDRRARVLCTAAVPRVKQAAAAWQKAIELWERVVADAPRQRGYWNDWVNVTFNRIEMWKSQAQPREAEKDYRTLVPVMEKRCQAFPGDPEYLADLALGLSGWAKMLRQLNRGEEAGERLRQAIDRMGEAVQKKRTDATYHRLLCGYQLAAGDDKGAADSVRAWTKDVPPPQARYQEAAQVLARCASRAAREDTADGKGRAETYARDAVALLQKAVQQGFRNPTFLKTAAFDALKERADFKKIVRAIEKK